MESEMHGHGNERCTAVHLYSYLTDKSSFTGCLFVLAFFFRLDDVLDGFADRQFVQDAQAWGNSLDQLVQEIAGSTVSAVKDGDISEVDVFEWFYLLAGNLFPLVDPLILDRNGRIGFGGFDHRLETIGFSQQ